MSLTCRYRFKALNPHAKVQVTGRRVRVRLGHEPFAHAMPRPYAYRPLRVRRVHGKASQTVNRMWQHLLAVENELNHRPRHVLNGRAPADLFAALLAFENSPAFAIPSPATITAGDPPDGQAVPPGVRIAQAVVPRRCASESTASASGSESSRYGSAAPAVSTSQSGLLPLVPV